MTVPLPPAGTRWVPVLEELHAEIAALKKQLEPAPTPEPPPAPPPVEPPPPPPPPIPTPLPTIPAISSILAVQWRDGSGTLSVPAGFYLAPPSTRTTPLALKLDPNAVILTGPVSFPGLKNWERVTPDGNPAHVVWKWANTGVTPQTIGYGRTLEDPPTRLACWAPKGDRLATPAAWATTLHTNRSYTFGFVVFGWDVYARFPGDVDPNTLTVTLGKGPGLAIDGPDVHVTGGRFHATGTGLWLGPNAQRAVLADLTTVACYAGVWIAGDKRDGVTSKYGADHLLERLTLTDNELWRADGKQIPWGWIKGSLVLSDGTYYGNRIGEANETAGIYQAGGAQNVLVKDSTIDGCFDGIKAYNSGFDRYATYGLTARDILIKHCADDALEPEQVAINHRYERVRAEYCATYLSTGPVSGGPIDLTDPVGWRIGAPPGSTLGVANGPFFKYSRNSNPVAAVRVTRGIFWTDLPNVDGSGDYAGGGGASEAFVFRQSIIRTTRYALQTKGNWDWRDPSNRYVTTDKTRGLADGTVKLTGPEYTDVGPVDALLVDPANGDLRRKV